MRGREGEREGEREGRRGGRTVDETSSMNYHRFELMIIKPF